MYIERKLLHCESQYQSVLNLKHVDAVIFSELGKQPEMCHINAALWS